MRPSIVCKLCGISFQHNSSLKRHLVKTHPSSSSEETSSGKYFQCDICNVKFLKELNLKSHLKFHNPYNFIHQKLSFDSLEKFAEWKTREEQTHLVFFKKSRTFRGKNTIHYYHCHRKGNYVSRSKGARRLKVQGSCKMGTICPAKITVHEEENGTCSVEYNPKHVGHAEGIQHLRLSTAEKKTIAEAIANKVPFREILDRVHDSAVSNTSLGRIHLLNIQDLQNIEKRFNLHGVRKRSADVTSVEAWVKDMQSSDDPCVLYYKAQGETDAYSKLEDEFNLIVMTKPQEEILKKCGSNVVCIETVCGSNLILNTIIVLDELRQPFPCAFFVSNEIDVVSISRFLEFIKARTGSVHCKIFMSNIQDVMYEAWVNIMGVPGKRRFCTWHVDLDWKENLKMKVLDESHQLEVLKRLKSVLEETREETFYTLLENLLSELSSATETRDFALFLEENYSKNVEYWASCFWKYFGQKINRDIEQLSHIVKKLFLKKKFVHLDTAICGIMKFVRSKVFDRVCVLTKGKVTREMQAIRSNHTKSSCISENSIIKLDAGWLVKSGLSTHLVERILDACDCMLICDLCQACIHQFTCTCAEENMCPHIHALCVCLKENIFKESDSELQLIQQDLCLEKNAHLKENSDVELCEVIEVDEECEPVCTHNVFHADVPHVEVQIVEIIHASSSDQYEPCKDVLKHKFDNVLHCAKSNVELNAVEKCLDNLTEILDLTRDQNCAALILR